MGSDNTQSETEGLNAITPITVTHPERVDIDALRLFREPAWMLRLTIEGARVIDPASQFDEITDLHIANRGKAFACINQHT